MTLTRKADWLIPAGLITLSVIPMIGGIVRLRQILEGVTTEDNARFLAAPWPVTLHIGAVAIY